VIRDKTLLVSEVGLTPAQTRGRILQPAPAIIFQQRNEPLHFDHTPIAKFVH
jgi:hypothetical protein